MAAIAFEARLRRLGDGIVYCVAGWGARILLLLQTSVLERVSKPVVAGFSLRRRRLKPATTGFETASRKKGLIMHPRSIVAVVALATAPFVFGQQPPKVVVPGE